ncbi:MAG: hypothetical protein DRR08_27915 [Candidatus Parabeggiatoa sp. nov. 2]|nr:MAG: hypothetical protein DRR08_27915 [Gammaproteobacteria bacterium]
MAGVKTLAGVQTGCVPLVSLIIDRCFGYQLRARFSFFVNRIPQFLKIEGFFEGHVIKLIRLILLMAQFQKTASVGSMPHSLRN